MEVVVVVDMETEVLVIARMVVKMVVVGDVVGDGRAGGRGSAGTYTCNKVHFTL